MTRRRVATQDRRPEAGQPGRSSSGQAWSSASRGRTRRLVRHALGHRGPQRRLQHWPDPDRRRRRLRVDGQQAGLFQRREGALAAGRDVAAAREELACRGSGEDGLGNAVPVQQRGQGQQQLGRPVRRQLVRPSEQEHPCHRGGRRPCAGRLGQLLPPAHEMGPVLAARQRRAGDHRAGLGQRDRLEVHVPSQLDRTEPLVRVSLQASVQIANCLAHAERTDWHDPHAAGDGRRVGGGHQHPAGRTGRPQSVKVRRAGQVIEYHQPRTAGLAQPAEELGGD